MGRSSDSEPTDSFIWAWLGRAGEGWTLGRGPSRKDAPAQSVLLLVRPGVGEPLQAVPGGGQGQEQGWRRGALSSRGRSPGGPGRRPSRPGGTLCPRRTAGDAGEGRAGWAGWGRSQPPARLCGGRAPRHDLLDVEVGGPVFPDAGTWPMPTTPTTTEGTHFLGSAGVRDSRAPEHPRPAAPTPPPAGPRACGPRSLAEAGSSEAMGWPGRKCRSGRRRRPDTMVRCRSGNSPTISAIICSSRSFCCSAPRRPCWGGGRRWAAGPGRGPPTPGCPGTGEQASRQGGPLLHGGGPVRHIRLPAASPAGRPSRPT